MWFIKKAIVAFHIFQKIFSLFVARRRAQEMYCTIPSVKQSFSASIPLFSFSINILSFFLFLHTSDTWRQIRCRILFEASEKNFANRSGVKSFTAMIQIDMNLDFESYFSRGLFFPGFFPPLLPLNLIEEAQSSLISYLAKLAHRSNQQWNRNSKREALTVSASATLIKPLRLTRLPSFIFCQEPWIFYCKLLLMRPFVTFLW